MADKIQDAKLIKDMFEMGKTFYVDPKNDYKYNVYACCPNDEYECSATRFEREGMDYEIKVGKITKVIFSCPICSNVFSAEPENLLLI